ncbi:MAG TPA: hypothetical protein VKA68_09510 [bacterium]|nr:hypothetical protein [bacterium]
MTSNLSRSGELVCCPFLETPCLRGQEQADECNRRVHAEFNPLQNYRDFMILCCANERRQMEGESEADLQ